jgi:hypothetical protein
MKINGFTLYRQRRDGEKADGWTENIAKKYFHYSKKVCRFPDFNLISALKIISMN